MLTIFSIMKEAILPCKSIKNMKISNKNKKITCLYQLEIQDFTMKLKTPLSKFEYFLIRKQECFTLNEALFIQLNFY